ncbi:MAG: HAD-IA family hydrolase [Verrucomicrobia bacterium]|nr:HAD-IA family hydrolase [Leptolyngbya sp. ES-bin-22]
MPAIFFGSIGTIADTSERQRHAFNQAFARHHLNWNWSREEYVALLEKSGGRSRIEAYAQSIGQSVDAEAVHSSKSELFQQSLREDPLEPRAGVVEVMQKAKQNGLKLALVTTTSEQNVLSMLEALGKEINASDFDLVVSASQIENPKPANDAYAFALKELDQRPDRCVAIEDNLGGVEAAKSAALACVAFPNENTAHHTFKTADLCVSHLDFEQLQRFL